MLFTKSTLFFFRCFCVCWANVLLYIQKRQRFACCPPSDGMKGMDFSMKHRITKQIAAISCAVLLGMGSMSIDAAAVSLVAVDLADVVDTTAPSVVEVFTETKQVSRMFREYVTEGAGSGVILTENGYLVTNNHVVEGASTIRVRLNNGQAYPAVLVGTDAKTDLAVLKIEAAGLPAAKLADSAKVRAGDFVIAIGNPLGELGGTVTEGIISAKDRQVTIDGQSMTLLQTSAAVNPGNSGGGLFNLNGELVGVVNSKTSGGDIEGLAFAIPANTVKTIVQQLIQNGYVAGRPQLGVSVMQLGSNSYYQGVYIAQSMAGNGLQAGDCILKIDGSTVSSFADITAMLDRHQVGDTVTVTVLRGGREMAVRVKLTEQKPSQYGAEPDSGAETSALL